MNKYKPLAELTSRRLARLSTWSTVLLVAALACQPLLGNPPRGHDTFLHYFRIPAVSDLWRHGILFSRWVPDLIYGYGSPLFNFYPPLSAYLLTALYWLVGQNGPLAYSLSYGVALLIATISMFLLGRHLLGSLGGLLAAAAYVWSPQVLLQTYSRGSLSNALALAFAPLAAFALLRVAQQPAARRIALAVVTIALVLASHAASGLLFIPILLLLGLAATRFLYRTRPAPVLAAVLLGLALAAFAWLPGLLEIGATRYAASVAEGGAEYPDHFAALFTWPEPTIVGLAKTPLPHNIGLLQLLLGAAAVVLSLWRWRNARHASPGHLALFISLSAIVGFGIFFFATPASAWFWENVTPLRQLQFPWRLLDLPVFLLALAVAWWLTAVRPRWRPWLPGAALILLYLNAVPYLYPARLTSLPQQPTLAGASHVQQARGIIGLTAWGEYSSKTVAEWPAGPAFPGADRGAPLSEKLELPENVDLRAAAGGLLAATWELAAPKATTVTLSVHYFPGWRAELDGAAVAIKTDVQGRMRIRLPAGVHELTVQWTRTSVRWLADGLSLLALAGLGWLSLPRGDRSRPQQPVSRGAIPDAPGATAGWLLVLLAALLVLKVAILDTTNTPLVVHPDAQHIPGVARPEHGDFGAIRLIGYEMVEPDLLALYWYPPRQVDRPYTVRVTLADARGVPVKEIDNSYPGDKPTTTWEARVLVRDVYELPVAERPAPIGYTLSVAVLDPETGEPLAVRDGPPGAATVGVGTLKRAPQPVALSTGAQPFDALFGEAIALTHTQLPQTAARGEPVPLILFWESRAAVDQDYTVFVHLLRPDGEFVAAFDAQPLEGLYPTSFWAPGEIIADSHTLRLDVAPGDYLLQIGLYELESGARLPLTGSSAELPDRITVGLLAVR